MPDTTWPPAPRHAARILHAIMYASGGWCGWSLATNPPAVASDMRPLTVATLGFVALTAGAAGALGALAHRWRVEWGATWLLAGAFLAFLGISATALVTGGRVDHATNALVTGLTAAYLARALELLVFSLRARRARVDRMDLWRRVGEEIE